MGENDRMGTVHDRAAASTRKTSPLLIGGLVAALILGVLAFAVVSMRVSRDIEHRAAITGSSTKPKDPGSNMDRTNRTTKDETEPMHDTNVPPAKPK